MPRDYRLYLEDILESISRIMEYTKDMDENDFLQNNKTQDAVVRNLQVIGEAAKRLPDHIFHQSTEIDWRKIKAMRNILVHEYFGINENIVWDIVINKLNDLHNICQSLLQE